MILTIDFNAKTISVEDAVNMAEFIKTVQSVLIDWKDYRIVNSEKTNYIQWVPQYPIVTYQVDNVPQPDPFFGWQINGTPQNPLASFPYTTCTNTN